MRKYGMDMLGTIDMVKTQILREKKGSSIGYDAPQNVAYFEVSEYLSYREEIYIYKY